MTTQTPATVPYEVFQREREKRIQAERDRDYYKREFFLSRKIRQAPVLRPIDKDVLEEFRHVQKWGMVEDHEGNKRANFTTIANHLKVSPDTVARSAERLEKLQLAEIREHQGPEDERERKYIQVKEERLVSIDTLKDPNGIVPKQGGNRYICPKCDSTDVAIKTVKTIYCNKCHHEEVIEDTGWKMQNGHKEQKQLAFKKSRHAQEQNTESSPPEKQLGDHSVYTQGGVVPEPEKQVAFAELQALPQWVVWKYEQKPGKAKRDKVPYNVHRAAENARADVSDPRTWSTYDEAKALVERSQRWHTPYTGVGFVFKAGGGIVGIDYDNSLDIRINSYSEISVSGNGVHTYVHGSIPKGTRRNGIEMYDSGRFFTWTGNHLAGTPEVIEDCQAELDALYKELAPETIPIQPTPVNFTCSRSDEEILEKARNARNGAKFTALYGGDWSGYHSQSEADQALCKMLAYWADNDVSTIDRLFQQSRLYRDKWNEKRGSQTYGEITMYKAIGQNWQIAS